MCLPGRYLTQDLIAQDPGGFLCSFSPDRGLSGHVHGTHDKGDIQTLTQFLYKHPVFYTFFPADPMLHINRRQIKREFLQKLF